MLLLFAAGLVRGAVDMGYGKVHLQEVYSHKWFNHFNETKKKLLNYIRL